MQYRGSLSLVVASIFFPLASSSTAVADEATLDAKELCQRLVITEEIIVLDPSGTHLIDDFKKDRLPQPASENGEGKETKDKNAVACRRGSSTGQTSSSFDGGIFFNHEWTVKADGTISVTYEQGKEFEGHGRAATLVESQGSHKVDLKDFSTISWVSPLHKKQKVIVRLIPSLIEGERRREIGKFPMYLDEATVFDGKGRLWTMNLSASGDYIGVITMQGSLMLSLQPFPEGTIRGRASGKQIRFKTKDGVSVLVKSDSVILPGDLTADVYVMFDPSAKAESIGSQSVSSGKDAADTLNRLNRHAKK